MYLMPWAMFILGVDVAFEDEDGGAGDARLELAAIFANLDVDVAEAAHIFTLRDGEGVAGAQFFVAYEIGAERTAGGAGSGIFDDSPRKHAASGNVTGFFQSKTVGDLTGSFGGFLKEVRVALNFAQGGARGERHHEIWNAGGDGLNGKIAREIGGTQTERFGEELGGNFCVGKFGGLLSHGDANGAAVVERKFDGKNAGAGLLKNFDLAFGGGNHAELSKQKPSADDGMSGEREFLLGGEDAEAGESAIGGWFLDENGLGEIHFAGDGLHGGGKETVAVGDHGEGITEESFTGEDVELIKASLQIVLLSSRG
jgi:hypothetical protein